MTKGVPAGIVLVGSPSSVSGEFWSDIGMLVKPVAPVRGRSKRTCLSR